MDCLGLLSVAYRLVIGARNGNIYTIKNGKLVGGSLEMETQVAQVLLMGKSMIVWCMDDTIHGLSIKGTRHFSLSIPEGISAVTKFSLQRLNHTSGYLVATVRGEVRMYSESAIITKFNVDSFVEAMQFGAYGREDACLAMVSKNGGLTIKILQRKADLKAEAAKSAIPVEQDVPLNIPPRTQLYIDQTTREREQATDMHRLFQRDLCKLRLSAAQTFYQVISDGQGPLATGAGTLHLSASVHGLGPSFQIRMTLRNNGTDNMQQTMVTITFNRKIYRISRPCFVVPLLLQGGVSFKHDINVYNLDPNGAADDLRIVVCVPEKTMPILCALVKMPMSQGIVSS